LSLTVVFLVFQTTIAFASELEVIDINQDNQQDEYSVSQDSVINAEEEIVIPKLIIEDGATVVEINADVETIEVRSQSKVELVGNGNINTISITTGQEVVINTTGNIQRLEVTNNGARLVVSEGTKIAELVLPAGTNPADIITNYEQVKDRFENIIGGGIEEIEYIPEPIQEPTQEDDFNFDGEQGGSSFNVYLEMGATATVGTIPSGVSNIFIQLDAGDVDVDLEIWDTSDEDGQIPVLVYGNPDSFQEGTKFQSSWSYNGLQFAYSGWAGVNNNAGKEWITIEGTTDRAYTIKVKNYEEGTDATVDYSWGNEGESSTWVIDNSEEEELSLLETEIETSEN